MLDTLTSASTGSSSGVSVTTRNVKGRPGLKAVLSGMSWTVTGDWRHGEESRGLLLVAGGLLHHRDLELTLPRPPRLRHAGHVSRGR